MADEQAVQATEKKEINLGNWISRAWDLLTDDLGAFVILGFIWSIIVGVASGTVIGVFLVLGPLTVGLFIVVFDKIRGKSVNIGDIAKGFHFFVASVLASILVLVFWGFGFMFCVIPAFIVAGLYIFTLPFIADKKLDFWEAMEASRKLAKDHLFEMILFSIILGLINFAGLLLCVVGLVFTIPLTVAAISIAYDDLVGIEKIEEES
jgi:uncharacterized membrane protein